MTGKDVALAVALVCKEWSAIVSEQTLWRALYLNEWELSKRDHIDINLHREFSFAVLLCPLPTRVELAKIQQDSQNHIDDQRIFVTDDQQGTTEALVFLLCNSIL